MKFIYNTEDEQIIKYCNGEGFIYLYYQRSRAYFFFFISISSIFIIMPIYLIKFKSNSDNKKNEEINSILKPTVVNAYDSPFKLWVILFISLLYTIFSYYNLYLFRKKIQKVNQRYSDEKKLYENSLDSLIAKYTIHIRGVNKNIPYLEVKSSMEAFFEQYFSQSVLAVQVIPNYDILNSLIDRKFNYQSQIDFYNSENTKNFPNRSLISGDTYFTRRHKVDAEIYYTHWVDIINKMIYFYRNLNMQKNTGNVFVCFKSPSLVDSIVNDNNILLGKIDSFQGTVLDISNWVIKRAPAPSDIIWDNIKYTKKQRTIKIVIFTIILFIVCLLIITPNFLNNELSPIIQSLSNQIEDEQVSTLITEYSYPLIVVLMNSLIIPYIAGYTAIFENHYKRSYREKSIFVKNFVFMIVNYLIIPTFGILNIDKIKSIFSYFITTGWDWDISEPLIRNSYFFMRYIIQVTFISNGIQLLALPMFFVKKFRIFLARTNYEKFYASLVKKYFDYGYNYSFSITVFFLTFTFSTTIPLIVPFGGLFFIIKYFVDKYNLLFVYPVEFESHGNLTDLVMQFELVGIFFFQFIISNLFIKIYHNQKFTMIAPLLYIIISIFMYFYMKDYFIKYEDENQTILKKVFNKLGISNFLFQSKNLFRDSIDYVELRNSFLSINSKEEISEEQLIKIMNEAYMHPAEKKNIVNPFQIWNDSYNYMKNITGRISKKNDSNLFEYNDVISNESIDI